MRSYSKFIQLTAFLGVLNFVLAGVGHNVVDYCCDSCETAGIEYLSSHSCHELHHPEHAGTPAHDQDALRATTGETAGCAHHNEHPSAASVDETCSMNEGHCELERLQLDNYPVTATLQLQVAVAVITLPAAVLSEEALTTIQSDLFLHYPPPEPMLRMGRRLLAQKSVLII